MSRLPINSLAYALLEASRIDAAVLAGQSLADGLLGRVDPLARPAVQDLVYGSLRAYGRGDYFLGRLLDKPLADDAVRALLLVAVYRLETRPDIAHTVVDQAVTAAGEVAGGRCRGLVNAVLRAFLRRQAELSADLAGDAVAAAQHPDWWLAELQAAYPETWPAIVAAGNAPPPMGLRVNSRRIGRDAYQAQLAASGIAARPVGESGLALARPQAVDALPGFADGLLSVQDPGAQRAAELLDPAPGSRVLDACAAPGGKTAHLLERTADLDLLALDLKPSRCRRIADNLDRLGLHAEIKVADCARPADWWDGRPFDAILLDAPCSASGIVRRHPDARWLRRPGDIAELARTQAELLDALWPLLKPGGRLVYATCSVFLAEGQAQTDAFAQRTIGVNSRPAPGHLLPVADNGPQDGEPGVWCGDGFFYARLDKAA